MDRRYHESRKYEDDVKYSEAYGHRFWSFSDGISRVETDSPIGGCVNIMYYKDRKIHRDDGAPAIEWATGTKEWYINGVFIKREIE